MAMSSTEWSPRFKVEDYTPPQWALDFEYQPKHRIKLAQLPTPIHKWNIPGVSSDFDVYIKRDDLTGSTLSGNKVRKLEFALAEAVYNGLTDVVTTGDLQSNHCRTTAVSATQLGLKTHIIVKSSIKDIKEVPCDGNMFLNRMCGAHLYFCDANEPYGEDIKNKMKEVANTIKKSTGKEAYMIPRGGSNKETLYSYIEAYNEMVEQGIVDNITDIVIACGSAGSSAGLAIANYIVSGHKIRVHGFKIANFNADYTYKHIEESLDQLGIHNVQATQIFNFIEKYYGEGYSLASERQLELMADISVSTGIILDPTYTGKCVYGMVSEINNNQSIFKGKKILFVYTGGIFGALQGRMDAILKSPGSATNRCHISHQDTMS